MCKTSATVVQLLYSADMLNSSLNFTAGDGEFPPWFDDDDFDLTQLNLTSSDLLPERLPEPAVTAFCVLYVTIIVLALGGNCMTALVVGVNRKMWTVTNAFLVSLAVSDALIAGINMPLQLQLYQQNEWTLGEVACKLRAYSQGVVIVASILTLTSLAINRYAYICHR